MYLHLVQFVRDMTYIHPVRKKKIIGPYRLLTLWKVDKKSVLKDVHNC